MILLLDYSLKLYSCDLLLILLPDYSLKLFLFITFESYPKSFYEILFLLFTPDSITRSCVLRRSTDRMMLNQ